jgi:3D (Asp-Asp-Asp) domain-containing protein
MAEPLPGEEPWSGSYEPARSSPEAVRRDPGSVKPVRSRRLHDISDHGGADTGDGRVLGKFRNTYYDLPNQRDFEGAPTPLFDARCRTIERVPRAFFESLCVQGSGLLNDARTVSFARRGCPCAEICPKTQQRICFDVLSTDEFPWGRGALGTPIVPLLTIAVDSQVIPLKSGVYIPEFDGLPREESGNAPHDGCFVAQDRGLEVRGRHVDVFTGEPSMTALWNRLVPSNRGVTVVLGTARCARAPDL